MENTNPFVERFQGSFINMMRWPQWDALRENLINNSESNWYVYAIGEAPPNAPLSADQLAAFLNEIDDLLRKEHQEEYCGIVYADNQDTPTFIKIYDPNNLGVTCGYSDNPPLPGWTLSQIPPCDLEHTQILPENRKRWWKRLFQSR